MRQKFDNDPFIQLLCTRAKPANENNPKKWKEEKKIYSFFEFNQHMVN